MGSSLIIYAQVVIVASGTPSYTVGEVFPIMQQDAKNYVPLSVPKFEVPIEKSIVKNKLTFWQRILKLFNFK